MSHNASQHVYIPTHELKQFFEHFEMSTCYIRTTSSPVFCDKKNWHRLWYCHHCEIQRCSQRYLTHCGQTINPWQSTENCFWGSSTKWDSFLQIEFLYFLLHEVWFSCGFPELWLDLLYSLSGNRPAHRSMIQRTNKTIKVLCFLIWKRVKWKPGKQRGQDSLIKNRNREGEQT